MANTRLKNSSLTQIGDAFSNEWSAILTDRGAILVLLIAVWIYPFIYSIAYKNNVIRDIPMTVVDLDKTALSRQLIRMIGATQEVGITRHADDFNEAEALFREDANMGIIVIPSGFEQKILKGEQTNVGLYCDAGYFLIYKETLKGTLRATGTLSAGVEIRRTMSGGSTETSALAQRDPISLKSYPLYNPSGAYGSNVMPGLILIILQQTLMVGIGMIGGARREKQKLLVSSERHKTPVILNVLTGRSLAYFSLSLLNLLFTEIVLFEWFGFPNLGSLLDLTILMIPFLFSVIFMGLTVSLLMKRREHSIMMLVFLSPLILFLSGMSWPSSSIPPLLHFAACLFPSTSMIPAFLRIRTMGGTLANVRPEFLFMTGQMLVYGLLTMYSYKLFLHRRSKTIRQPDLS